MLKIWLPLNGHTNNQGLSDVNLNIANVSFADGKFGKCLQNGSVTIPADKTADILNNQSLTIAFWVYVNADTGSSNNRAMLFGTNSMGENNNRKFSLFQYPTCNDLHYSWMNDKDGVAVSGGILSSVLPSYKWTHVAVVYNNPNAEIYINGSLKTTFTFVSNSSSFAYDTIMIHDSSYHMFNDYRIYDNALSPKEVKLLSQGLVCHYPLNQQYVSDNLATRDMIASMNSFYNVSKSYDRDSDTWTITTTGVQATWGNGISMSTSKGKILVPYNKRLFISFYIKVPTACSMNYDINNYANSGSSWSGNDNDVTNLRTSSGGFNFTETDIWLYRWISYSNTNTKNTEKVDLYDVTGFGIKRNDSDPSITYQIRNLKYEILPDSATKPTIYSQKWSEISNEKMTEYDTSGFNNHGTIATDLALDEDSPRHDYCYLYSPKQYIRGETPFGATKITTVTINLWVYQDSGCGAYSTIFDCRGYSGAGIWLGVNVENSGQWSYIGSNSPSYCRGGDVSLNTWHMFTYVFDNGDCYWYLDGKRVGNKVTYTNKYLMTNDTFTLGDSFSGSTWNTTFIGKLSDFRMYATVLSDEDVLNLYKVPISLAKTGTLMTQGEFIEG